jgi:2-methylcitrate dehydratase PrpD
MQDTLAEALFFGELTKDAYRADSLAHPDILRLADAVTYSVDREFPGPERFKGALSVVMDDGSTFDAIEEHNRGSAANPMTRDELTAKFQRNAAAVLSSAQSRALIATVAELESVSDAAAFVQRSLAG